MRLPICAGCGHEPSGDRACRRCHRAPVDLDVTIDPGGALTLPGHDRMAIFVAAIFLALALCLATAARAFLVALLVGGFGGGLAVALHRWASSTYRVIVCRWDRVVDGRRYVGAAELDGDHLVAGWGYVREDERALVVPEAADRTGSSRALADGSITTRDLWNALLGLAARGAIAARVASVRGWTHQPRGHRPLAPAHPPRDHARFARMPAASAETGAIERAIVDALPEPIPTASEYRSTTFEPRWMAIDDLLDTLRAVGVVPCLTTSERESGEDDARRALHRRIAARTTPPT